MAQNLVDNQQEAPYSLNLSHCMCFWQQQGYSTRDSVKHFFKLYSTKQVENYFKICTNGTKSHPMESPQYPVSSPNSKQATQTG